MKRIERNTYNSLRKSITADTLNVEIPVEYTHEGRQGIHEMLTVEKHMRASVICWNSIINGYVIHYVPTVDEYTEAQRMEQEAQDIDEIMNALPKSDRTWNGYEKPAEEQTTDTEEEEEENTVEKIKVVYEKKEGRTYTETWRSEKPEEVYERLSHCLIAKKLNNCTWIKSIKRVPLYNGFDRITITHDNGGRDVYTVASH
jgi:hypothetical protein